MNSDNRVPSWGVLVKSNPKQIKLLIRTLQKDFDFDQMAYHTEGEWTAVFYMEPSSSGDDAVAEVLRMGGIVPVYRFDFSRYGYFTWQWDGQAWTQGQDPGIVLGTVGLWIPGWPRESPAFDPAKATTARRALVVEGTTLAVAKSISGANDLRMEFGPMGAIAYGPDIGTRTLLWERAPARVFEILYYPKSGNFTLTVLKGDRCLGTFRPGETRTWDGTPFLPDFEGETTAKGVLDKLGIPRSFLDPLPPSPATGEDDKA
jgi:hypothetical protein